MRERRSRSWSVRFRMAAGRVGGESEQGESAERVSGESQQGESAGK